MNIVNLLSKSIQAAETAKSLYWKKRTAIAEMTRQKVLIPHHKEHKTSNLLWSAIVLCDEVDAKSQLVLLAAALES